MDFPGIDSGSSMGANPANGNVQGAGATAKKKKKKKDKHGGGGFQTLGLSKPVDAWLAARHRCLRPAAVACRRRCHTTADCYIATPCPPASSGRVAHARIADGLQALVLCHHARWLPCAHTGAAQDTPTSPGRFRHRGHGAHWLWCVNV